MRPISRATICRVVVLGTVYLGGCKPIVVPIVPPPPPPPPKYDQNQISCSIAPNKICAITFETVKSKGGYCVLDPDAPPPPDPGGHTHLPFSMSVRSGDRLIVLPKAGSPLKARFREFKLVAGPTSCPVKPFSPGSNNGFGEDLTGPPVNFNHVAGCTYKMTVQTQELGSDFDHPGDPKDGGKKYLCVDPHFEMIDVN